MNNKPSQSDINIMIDNDISQNKRHAESAKRSAEWHEKQIEKLMKMKECLHHEEGDRHGNWASCKHCGYTWYVSES